MRARRALLSAKGLRRAPVKKFVAFGETYDALDASLQSAIVSRVRGQWSTSLSLIETRGSTFDKRPADGAGANGLRKEDHAGKFPRSS